MLRLFVAVDFPDTVCERIANICYGIPKARWMPLDQLHLTVQFIGEVEHAAFEEIRSALAEVDSEDFSLTLKGVGYFPPRKDPTVVWVGVEQSDPLVRLANRVQSALRCAGVEPEKRKFHPHVTIARFKNRVPASQVMPFVVEHGLFTIRDIPVGEFFLYSSVLTRDGAIHKREAAYELLGEEWDDAAGVDPGADAAAS